MKDHDHHYYWHDDTEDQDLHFDLDGVDPQFEFKDVSSSEVGTVKGSSTDKTGTELSQSPASVFLLLEWGKPC